VKEERGTGEEKEREDVGNTGLITEERQKDLDFRFTPSTNLMTTRLIQKRGVRIGDVERREKEEEEETRVRERSADRGTKKRKEKKKIRKKQIQGHRDRYRWRRGR